VRFDQERPVFEVLKIQKIFSSDLMGVLALKYDFSGHSEHLRSANLT
jgi:hypothetical protein